MPDLNAAPAVDWLDTAIQEVLDALPTDSGSPSALLPLISLPSAPSQTEFVDLEFGRAAVNVLGQVIMGFSPVIDPRQGVIATRLTVVPVHTDAMVDAGALLDALSEVWPEGGSAVSLNVASEDLLGDLLRARPSSNVMIEVPAFVAADPVNADALRSLWERGNALLLKGRPLRELPRTLLPCFRWSIIDTDEDRRGAAAPLGSQRRIPFIQSGVHTMTQLQQSFAAGAIAVIGWPLHDSAATGLEPAPDRQVVREAIRRIDEDAPACAVDHVLMRDPVLAYELMKHLAAQDALSFEAGSLQHAVSMLGHARLRDWLAGLLERSVDDILLRSANFAALRRGLLMRMLADGAGQREARGELFLCGVFSLLDRIAAQPLAELMQRVALPEHVHAALIERSGPYFALLELARAIESEVPHDIRTASEAAFVAPLEINRALLRTLLVAAHLERGAG